ncbi:MAG TPA: thermonuclease family protein [Hyphomicrobiaceae bacterium]|nr:thermonuclease family protein [Hyphomicrobiaceae bacterium]
MLRFPRSRWRPRRNAPPLLLVVFALLALAAAARLVTRQERPGEVSGWSHVIDGDSLQVAGREVRLVGIDAPEGRQTCRRDGVDWNCGNAARIELRRLIGNRRVTCRYRERDRYDRLLALCEANGRSLNAAMVSAGYAVDDGQFANEEAGARAERRGLWAGDFERPRDWRRRHGNASTATDRRARE